MRILLDEVEFNRINMRDFYRIIEKRIQKQLI